MPELLASRIGLAEGVKVEGGDMYVGFGEGGVEDGELLEVGNTTESVSKPCLLGTVVLGGGD